MEGGRQIKMRYIEGNRKIGDGGEKKYRYGGYLIPLTIWHSSPMTLWYHKGSTNSTRL